MDDRQGFGGQERFCFESPKEANTQDSRCLATTFFWGIHRKDRKMVQVQSKVRLMQGKCAFFQASCRYCMQIAVKMVQHACSNGSALRKARPHNVWVPGAVRHPPTVYFSFTTWMLLILQTVKATKCHFRQRHHIWSSSCWGEPIPLRGRMYHCSVETSVVLLEASFFWLERRNGIWLKNMQQARLI